MTCFGRWKREKVKDAETGGRAKRQRGSGGGTWEPGIDSGCRRLCLLPPPRSLVARAACHPHSRCDHMHRKSGGVCLRASVFHVLSPGLSSTSKQ
ncbi:hypothetical protein GW17_00015373 [Ensete ventricosum]|nr:hypothetical protein GW17_00015373 [Ensete ventricosum]